MKKDIFEKLIQEAKGLIFLTKAEKKEGLTKLVAFMKEHPVRSEQAARPQVISTFTSFVWSNKFTLRYASLASVFVLLISVGGVSLAANNALPGELFYDFKVNVNEKVLGFMQFSPERKAEYEIKLTELRFQELEEVVLMGRFNDKAKAEITLRLQGHLSKANERSNAVYISSGEDASGELNSRLEASLKVHKKIIGKIATDQKESHDSEKVRSFIPEIEGNIDLLAKKRLEMETNVSQKPFLALKVSAEGKMKAAKAKITEAGNFIESKKTFLAENSYNTAKASLDSANKVMAIGIAELEKGNYSLAFSLFQESASLAQEAKISAGAFAKLRIEMPAIKDSDEEDEENEANSNNNSEPGVINSLKAKVGL